MNIRIITPQDHRLWDEYVTKSNQYDFSHLCAYNVYSEGIQRGQARLFLLEDGSKFIAFPFIIRQLENSAFCDLTSVYGYPGPIFSEHSFDLAFFQNFVTQFNLYLERIDAISLYSRLNPFISNQDVLLSALNYVENVGKIVYIDLGDSDYKSRFSKQMRYDINKLIKQNYKCFIDDKLVYLAQFINIYYETMAKNSAQAYYYFEKTYFDLLFALSNADSKLVVCVDSNQNLASGAIFIQTKSGVQYHLSATSKLHRLDSPNKLVIDFAADFYYGKALFINLGGGVGGAEDSLFQFKLRFSSRTLDYKVLKYIVNNSRYQALSSANKIGDTQYFPAYRDSQ